MSTKRWLLAMASLLVTLVLSQGQAVADAYLATAGGQFNIPVKSMNAMRFQSVIHQQYDFSCGSAAVATLLTYSYNDPADEMKVFKWMWDHGDKPVIEKEGFSLLDMKNYLDAHGFAANGFRTSLRNLAKVNLPAIALIDFNGYMHFVVVKGVEQDEVLVGDPALGLRLISRKSFDAMWKKNGILFVITSGPDIKMAKASFNSIAEWDKVPRAPLAAAMQQQPSLGSFLLTLPRAGSF